MRKAKGGAGTSTLVGRGLRKSYGAFEAVKGVDFEVFPGECFGFLGPNGAGKTSTMKMIYAAAVPTGGELSVVGLDVTRHEREVKRRIGVVPQENNLDEGLKVRENLLVYGRYFGLPRATVRQRAAELLDFVQLTDRAGDRVEPLSGGMKRRLTIARALVNEPDVVLLDEPTTGLDPQARHVLWERLYRLRQRGVTLVLTTHYMDEAEQLCDRLVVMDRGRIAAEGSPAALIAAWSTREVCELRFPLTEGGPGPAAHADALAPLVARGLAERVEALPDRLLLYTADGDAALSAVLAQGLQPVSSLVRRSSLEDVFLRLTGRTLVD